MVQRVSDMERACDIRRRNDDAIGLAGMTWGSVEVSTLGPCLVPACFDCLGIVGLVELRCAHLVDLVYLVYLVCSVYLVHLVSSIQPKNQTNQTNQINKTCWQTFSASCQKCGAS